MNKPAFTETMQIGIVVRDLDATIQRYTDDYGIGPWQVHQFKREDVKEWFEHGQATEPSTRIATAMVGRVQWELIQPLDDKSIFARFLAEKGEGVQHIAVAASDFDETLKNEAQRGNKLVLSCELDGKFEGIKVVYLGTQRDLGVTLEIFNGLPESEQEKASNRPDDR